MTSPTNHIDKYAIICEESCLFCWFRTNVPVSATFANAMQSGTQKIDTLKSLSRLLHNLVCKVCFVHSWTVLAHFSRSHIQMHSGIYIRYSRASTERSPVPAREHFHTAWLRLRLRLRLLALELGLGLLRPALGAHFMFILFVVCLYFYSHFKAIFNGLLPQWVRETQRPGETFILFHSVLFCFVLDSLFFLG